MVNARSDDVTLNVDKLNKVSDRQNTIALIHAYRLAAMGTLRCCPLWQTQLLLLYLLRKDILHNLWLW